MFSVSKPVNFSMFTGSYDRCPNLILGRFHHPEEKAGRIRSRSLPAPPAHSVSVCLTSVDVSLKWNPPSAPLGAASIREHGVSAVRPRRAANHAFHSRMASRRVDGGASASHPPAAGDGWAVSSFRPLCSKLRHVSVREFLGGRTCVVLSVGRVPGVGARAGPRVASTAKALHLCCCFPPRAAES